VHAGYPPSARPGPTPMGWKAAARHLGLAFKAFAQYEEPPGGCGAPPIDDPVPPTPERVADGDAAAAEREARAYEAELAAHQSGAAEWETLEREHLWELFWRDTTQKIAALAAMVFVLWLLYSRYRQLRGGSTLTRESAKLGSGYKAPDKADLKAKASASGSGEASAVSDSSGPRGEQLRRSDGSPLPQKEIKTSEELMKAAAASRDLFERTVSDPDLASKDE